MLSNKNSGSYVCSWLHRFLTVLQGRHRLRLYAEDAVSNVVGGQHSKLVWGKRLQPADRRQALKHAHRRTCLAPLCSVKVLLIKEQQRSSVTWKILPLQPLVISPGSTDSLSGTNRTSSFSRSWKLWEDGSKLRGTICPFYCHFYWLNLSLIIVKNSNYTYFTTNCIEWKISFTVIYSADYRRAANSPDGRGPALESSFIIIRWAQRGTGKSPVGLGVSGA